VILSTDVPFRRLDHYKIHEYTKKWNMGQRRDPEPVMMTMTNNIDTMFKRKRGRPPKNRVIEVSGVFVGFKNHISQFWKLYFLVWEIVFVKFENCILRLECV
jgi:hypothetical protein